jgi:magnesium transporter
MTVSKFDLILEGVQKFMRRGATGHLTNMINKMHPADVGKVIQHLSTSHEKKEVFDLIRNVKIKAQVIKEVDTLSRTEILTYMPSQETVSILHELSSDDVAAIMGDLPAEKYQEVLRLMGHEDSQEVQDLLEHPKETAGRLMNTDFFSLPEQITVEEAIKQVRAASEREMVFYIYVTDKEDRLVGVVSLRQLLVVPPDTPLQKIMNPEVISVTTDTDQEEVARQVTRYNLLAIPVVDKENRLVGIITFDDVIDVLREEATEDILKMAGAGTPEEEYILQTSSLGAARFRLPWLLTTLFGTMVTAGIVWFFRFTLHEVIALVTFLPVIAAMGGNVGVQSSTIIVRGLATGRIELANVWKVVARELKVGLLMGVTCGVILALVAYLWHGPAMLGVVLGAAMFFAIIVAATTGTLVPVVLKKLNIDPAISSGPFVTTANDITGLLIYLGLATYLLQHLKL